MTSHAKDPRKLSKIRYTNSPDPRLWRALCGRYVPSWVFLPANECGCSQCREAEIKRRTER